MKNNDLLLFVVEGEKREKDLFGFLSSTFFARTGKIVPVIVPAEMNIYMLYSILEEDGFYSDIVEILRERVPDAKTTLRGLQRDDFSGVYLFFDFDGHANNLGKDKKGTHRDAVLEMLRFFSDPTEQGKLYLSFPMIEAFRDFVNGACIPAQGHCFIDEKSFAAYKNLTSVSNYLQISKYTFPVWRLLAEVYVKRVCCMLGLRKFDREVLLRFASIEQVTAKEMDYLERYGAAFILSAIPMFLIEYSRKNYEALIGRQIYPHLVPSCANYKP